MISFKQYVLEARRNPEQNPKISAYDALKQYADDSNVYITFTEIDKVGLNPQSPYNTPLGVYCYPLKEAWDRYNINSHKSLKGLPFASDRPNIYVIRLFKKDGFVNNMYSDYGSNNYDKDVKILEKIWKEEAIKRKNFFISYEYDQQKKLTINNIEKYEAILADNEVGSENIKKWEDKLNYWKEVKNTLDKQYKDVVENKMWNDLVDYALENAKAKNPIMSFWNLSRLMAIKLSKNTDGIKMATKWNSLLRKCGYTGFADKLGRGYIHPAEPFQAVFLTTEAFTVIDKILNKDYVVVKMKDVIALYKKATKSYKESIIRIFLHKEDPNQLQAHFPDLTKPIIDKIWYSADEDELYFWRQEANENVGRVYAD